MSFWQVFSVVFLIGLGGAMSPGPLLTYTIIKSIKAKKRGTLTGLFVSTGHMIIELLLILILMFGLGILIKSTAEDTLSIITIIIGILGGAVLIFFGSQLLYDIGKQKIDTSFLEITEQSSLQNEVDSKRILNKIHPIFGSMLFLMTNPYWWIWWSTFGFNIILDNSVTFQNIPAFVGLIIGKELGVYLWYTFIGTTVGLSSKFISKKVYLVILLVCAFFMAGYGSYLIIRPIVTFFIT